MILKLGKRLVVTDIAIRDHAEHFGGACDGNLFNSTGMEHDLMRYNNTVVVTHCFY
jgi:hypothetical protein